MAKAAGADLRDATAHDAKKRAAASTEEWALKRRIEKYGAPNKLPRPMGVRRKLALVRESA